MNDFHSTDDTESYPNDHQKNDNNVQLPKWRDHRKPPASKKKKTLTISAPLMNDSQITCSGYKYTNAEIDHNEEQLVDDNVAITVPFVRNPYNNVAASRALKTTPYELEETHPIYVLNWYLSTIVSNNPLEVTEILRFPVSTAPGQR